MVTNDNTKYLYVGEGTFGYTARYEIPVGSTLISAHTSHVVTDILVKIQPYYKQPVGVGTKLDLGDTDIDDLGHKFIKGYQLYDDCMSEYAVQQLAFQAGCAKEIQLVPMPLCFEVVPRKPTRVLVEKSEGVFDYVNLETGLFKIYMEYVHPPRPLTDADIPLMRDTFLEFTKLGFIHGDMNNNNFLAHPSGFVILIDFGSTLVWKSDYSAVKTDQLTKILQDYFGNFEAALETPKGIQYAWLANLLCADILSYNGCYQRGREKPYSLYHYLMDGRISKYDRSVKCRGETISDINFGGLFGRNLEIAPSNHGILYDKSIKFDPIPVESLALVNPTKLIVTNNNLSLFPKLPDKFKIIRGGRSRKNKRYRKRTRRRVRRFKTSMQ